MAEQDRDRPEVVVYGDYSCPFSYMTEALLARLRSEEGVRIEHRAFELRPAPAPLLDPKGEGLVRHWDSTVLPLARELGVEIRMPPVQPRTRKAHEAAAHAREAGQFEAMHASLYRAFFVDGADIGRIDVLVQIGEGVGLDPTGLKVALDIDQQTDRVLADQAEARARGIAAVPALLSGDRQMIGLHHYDAIRELVV
jgi:predicted DsbA family dithiol-disulfide isomerase